GPGLLLDYRVDVAEMFRIIIKEKPAYLTTFPSLLRELLRESNASGVLPQGLLEVRSTGEALSTEIRSHCEKLWGAKVSEMYSAAEIGIIAIPCPEQNALHVQSEGVFLEILRDDGTPCASGEEGRVVLTPLHNFVMPLIRYELGDRATLGIPCSCGRALPVLSTIPGRARDMITTPIYSHGEMMKLDAIVQHQVAQTAINQIEIRLVVRRPLTITEETQLLSIARAGLGTAHELRIVYCKEILRQESGKFAEFTNELNLPL
ncbi:MAG: phenylacetate--CoA ligase family protein, partial [Verrucomicrobia bacterium]|nr:phenylacetate--CoA ligase family protein [Verrucomicrobiota bacterium]